MVDIGVTRTASPVMSVTNTKALLRGEDEVVIFRCDECFALVAGNDARAHLWWHDSIMYANKPGEKK